jgi:hypothetical protein
MNNLPETATVNRQLYIEWNPQIMYNQHQTGPAGTVLFAPPFRDPFNYNYDPLVPMGIDLVSTSIHNRFVTEGKPGATMRRGGLLDVFNGGRARHGFPQHGGHLTEIIGSPTPGVVSRSRQPAAAPGPPLPIRPRRCGGGWSIDYVMSVNGRFWTSPRNTARTSSTASTRWAGTRSSAAAGRGPSARLD